MMLLGAVLGALARDRMGGLLAEKLYQSLTPRPDLLDTAQGDVGKLQQCHHCDLAFTRYARIPLFWPLENEDAVGIHLVLSPSEHYGRGRQETIFHVMALV